MKKILAAAAMVCAFGVGSAQALPFAIGVDPDGVGNPTYGFTYADLWTNYTDTGLATGFVPGKLVPPNAPYNVDFLYQARVGTMSNAGTPVTPFWNFPPPAPFPTYQLTLVTKLHETVVSNSFSMVSGQLHEKANFASGANGDIMSFYLSPTPPQANPNLVSDYTNGIHLFDADLLSQTSSFDFNTVTGTGTGSFDVKYKIDLATVNFSYVDLGPLASDFVFGYKVTGTTNIPTQYTPANMWDGTPTAGGILLKVDGSENFNKTQVPEPSTFVLLGAGLAVAGFARRYRRNS